MLDYYMENDEYDSKNSKFSRGLVPLLKLLNLPPEVTHPKSRTTVIGESLIKKKYLAVQLEVFIFTSVIV